jgi:hypothetical protein
LCSGVINLPVELLIITSFIAADMTVYPIFYVRVDDEYALSAIIMENSLVVSTDSYFITYLFHECLALCLWVKMNEAVEQLKRRVASLLREFEELHYRKDIDWLKTLQQKLVKDRYD